MSSQSSSVPELGRPGGCYPVRVVMMGSTNGRQLVDVDGQVLLTPWGEHLNVFNAALMDYFDTGKIRLLHCLHPGFRYFITSEEQARRFMYQREYGSEERGVTFFVYEDEDIDVDYYRYSRFIPKSQAAYSLSSNFPLPHLERPEGQTKRSSY